jgi:hypothetical protein
MNHSKQEMWLPSAMQQFFLKNKDNEKQKKATV